LHHEFNSGIRGLKYKFTLELQVCLKTQLLLMWCLSFIATQSKAVLCYTKPSYARMYRVISGAQDSNNKCNVI